MTMTPTKNYAQNNNKMSRQTHFSTMAAAVVPWPPWCHPACAEHTTTNQDHRPSFPPVEDTLDRDGMPLVWHRRMPWFGVSNASFVCELLEVVVSRQFIWYKNYIGICSGVWLFLEIRVFLSSSLIVPVCQFIIKNSTGFVVFARGQICLPRADLPAPIWRDHFFHY